MLRLVILTIVNISLPFLLWAFKIYVIRVWNKVYKKPLPEYKFPVTKLLFIGVLLLVSALITYRFIGVDENIEWKADNPSISQDY